VPKADNTIFSTKCLRNGGVAYRNNLNPSIKLSDKLLDKNGINPCLYQN